MSASGTSATPTTWTEFVGFLEYEWGNVETWGAKEFAALVPAIKTIVQNFDATAIAFVEAEVAAFEQDIVSGKMSLPEAATAVFNSAQAKLPGILVGVGTNALISLIATFVAGL